MASPERTSSQDVHDLERSIFRLGRALRKIRIGEGEHSSYATGAGFWELALLRSRGPIRATEISSVLALDISTVSRQIKSLESEGLVEKTPDTQDARAMLISLTAKGLTVITQLMSLRESMIEAALVDWSAEDRTHFDALLGRFVERLETSVDLPD